MKICALVSGGKDSLYAAWLLESTGWEVAELLTLVPAEPDAWLFHTPNLRWVSLLAEAWGKPHRAHPVPGSGTEEEVKGLTAALAPLRGRGFDGISVGAIASSFQWSRIQQVAEGLGLRVFAPLWRVDPLRVVDEEISSGLIIRIVQVASEPLGPELLGRVLDGPLLSELRARSLRGPRFNVAGEGGEYETLVTYAPGFSSRLEVSGSRTEQRGGLWSWTVTGARLAPLPPGRGG